MPQAASSFPHRLCPPSASSDSPSSPALSLQRLTACRYSIQSSSVPSSPVYLPSRPSLTLDAWHGQLSTPRCCLTFLFPRAWQQHNTARLQALVRLQDALTSQPATSAQHSSKRHGAARQAQPSSVQSNPAQPSQGKACSVHGRIIRPCPRRPTSTRRSKAAVAENNKAHHIGKDCDSWPVKDKSTCRVHLQGAEGREKRVSAHPRFGLVAPQPAQPFGETPSLSESLALVSPLRALGGHG